MKLLDLILIFLIKGKIYKSLKTVLINRISVREIKELNKSIFEKYKSGVRGLEKQQTIGASIMLRFAFLTHLCYEHLLNKGFDKKESIKLTAEINWLPYKAMSLFFWKLFSLFSKEPLSRLRKMMSFHIKWFPYNSPGYEMEILPSNEREFSFNVYKCPTATYFRRYNLEDLCKESWCNLDYPLASIFGLKLYRTKTLAEGYQLCNFRFLRD